MAAVSATDKANQKKVFRSGTTTLIFLNENLNETMKIKGVTKTIKNEAKNKKTDLLACK